MTTSEKPKTLWRRCYCCLPWEYKECTCTPDLNRNLRNRAQDAVALIEQLASLP